MDVTIDPLSFWIGVALALPLWRILDLLLIPPLARAWSRGRH